MLKHIHEILDSSSGVPSISENPDNCVYLWIQQLVSVRFPRR